MILVMDSRLRFFFNKGIELAKREMKKGDGGYQIYKREISKLDTQNGRNSFGNLLLKTMGR